MNIGLWEGVFDLSSVDQLAQSGSDAFHKLCQAQRDTTNPAKLNPRQPLDKVSVVNAMSGWFYPTAAVDLDTIDSKMSVTDIPDLAFGSYFC